MYSCASGSLSGFNCTGALSRTRYEAYGNTAAGAVPTGIGFTGHVNDADTGLVYMQQRYYDPIAGRFLSVDPIVTDANSGSMFNRYEYANNNPYRYIDPDGQAGWETICAGEDCAKTLAEIAIKSKRKVSAPASTANAPGGPYEEPSWEEIGTVADGVATAATFTPIGPEALAARAITKSVGTAAAKVVGEIVSAKGVGIVAKDGTKITGLTKHAVDRVIGDGAKRAGTKPDAILDAVANPNKIKEGVDNLGRPFKVYTGENARVVVNPENGKIISTNPLSREGAHLP